MLTGRPRDADTEVSDVHDVRDSPAVWLPTGDGGAPGSPASPTEKANGQHHLEETSPRRSCAADGHPRRPSSANAFCASRRANGAMPVPRNHHRLLAQASLSRDVLSFLKFLRQLGFEHATECSNFRQTVAASLQPLGCSHCPCSYRNIDLSRRGKPPSHATADAASAAADLARSRQPA